MNPTTINYSDETNSIIATDFVTGQDKMDAVRRAMKDGRKSRDSAAADNIFAATCLPDLVRGGTAQKDLPNEVGISPSYVSKFLTVGRVVEFGANGNMEGKITPHDFETMLARLQAYYDTDCPDGGFFTLLLSMVSDDGGVRAPAIKKAHGVFGAVEYMYGIAKGTRVHPDAVTDEDEDEDEAPEDDAPEDEDDSPTVSGEELIARGVRKMRESGATDQAIADYFMSVIGGK